MTFLKVAFPVVGSKAVWPQGYPVNISGNTFFKIAMPKVGSFTIWPPGFK